VTETAARTGAEQQEPPRSTWSASRPTLAVHGHFYQPAREDPFTGRVMRDPSAAPAHDWTDRVALESYAPNAELGNFERIGWDLGPTVARWMREHDAWTASLGETAAGSLCQSNCPVVNATE